MNLTKKKIGMILFFSSTLLIRILLGMKVSIWFPAAQRVDDLLMVIYALIEEHFSSPDIYSLVKYIGFPIFLQAVFHSHIPYAACLSILWWLCGLSGFFVMRRLSRSRFLPYLSALYLMFLPPAFEIWCGTRLYRNACVGPFSLFVLLFMILLLLRINEESQKMNLFLSLFLGIFFLFTYYLKEDGTWLFACVLLWFVIGFAYAFFRRQKQKIILFCIPLILFLSGSLLYRGINYHYFGVFETNTRTGGEPGRFCEIIYQIDSSKRTADVWAPYDAILQAFNASETLSMYPGLLQSIHDTSWFGGNIEEQPIPGDFLGWVLRSSLEECGIWENEAQIDRLFGTINRELEAAFKSKALSRQRGRIQLLPSAGSRSLQEILSLRSLIGEAFAGAVFLKGYTPGIEEVSPEETSNNIVFVDVARGLTNTPDLNAIDRAAPSYARTMRIVVLIFWIYRILNFILFVMLILLLISQIIKTLTKIKNFRQCFKERPGYYAKLLAAGLFLCIGILYAFSIGWFSSFLFQDGIDMRILNYYNIVLPELLALAYLFAAAALTE